MNSVFILIPIAFALVFLAIILFYWAVKSGQYDDLDAEGQRILFDQKPKESSLNSRKAGKDTHAE